MLCEIFVFATHDLDIDAEFPHEFSDWVDGGPVYHQRSGGGLSRQLYEGIEQTRTVTTEGLQGPPHDFSTAHPPKYPPHQLIGRRCDHTIIAAVEAHAQIVVYVIDTVDPDDYDSLPIAMQYMRPDDPVLDDVWTKIRNGLVNVTPVEHEDQVAAWLDNLRADHPLATARQLAIAVRNFTS